MDVNFERWLNILLGDKNYGLLNPGDASRRASIHHIDGRPMRGLMKDFNTSKKKFKRSSRVMHMDLPKPLHNLDIDGKAICGSIRITKCISFVFYMSSNANMLQ